MKQVAALLLAIAVVFGSAVAPAAMRGGGAHHPGGFRGRGGWHGRSGGHGFGHGPHVFIDGGFFFGAPFYWDYDPFYAAPYYYPYPPGYGYPYPAPPPDEETEAESGTAGEESVASSGSAEQASYGLVRLRGVPDGASVDLDGRFWLTADRLAERWVALPEGTHTITVRAPEKAPRTKRIDVDAGRSHVVDFAS